MGVWVVRAGKDGQFEDFAFDEGVALVDFGSHQSVKDFDSRDQLRDSISEGPYPESSKRTVGKVASQLWNFANGIQFGDMVVLPRKGPSRIIAVGRVSGDYVFRSDLPEGMPRHTRAIEWRITDIPREVFDQDLLYSLGSLLTVFQPGANNSEQRIERIVKARLNKGPIDIEPESDIVQDTDDDASEIDWDELIEDQIAQRLTQRFSGTRLEYLVTEILKASGYIAIRTRMGPDGGIDVLAGKGDMGFGEPRLCVQVKSGRDPVRLPDYNRLQGNIRGFGAQHGLLVSLSDFTRDVRNENERSFFDIRLWGPHELVGRLLETYDSLPGDIRTDIPLQNRRVLVESED